MCTDLVNLVLFDAGQDEFIDQFQLKMCFPDTTESKGKRESLSQSIQFIRDFNGLFDGAKLDEETQLAITKALLTMFIDNDDILRTLQEELEVVQEKKAAQANDKNTTAEKENGEAPLVGSDDSGASIFGEG